LRPSAESEIRIEVWLPLSAWNGRLLGIGNGGWGGRIVYSGAPLAPGLMEAVALGYAAASTDTGHDASVTGRGGEFAIGHPQRLVDYGHRAVHEMTVKAKAIVTAFYGTAPKHAYFVGCSLGGMEALVEARRYPADYDGIIAGAPANPMALLNAAQLWPAWLVARDPSKAMPAAKFTLVHEAALMACSTPVGRNDALIERPERCEFDPQSLLCRNGDAPDCLTAPQVELMRRIYEGPSCSCLPSPPRRRSSTRSSCTGPWCSRTLPGTSRRWTSIATWRGPWRRSALSCTPMRSSARSSRVAGS
jgi:feruloyl esterase